MKSTGAGYLMSENAKKGGDNTKKGVITVKSSKYLTLNAKKTFNILQFAFIEVHIF